jgi:hypothetical protein
MLLKRNLLRQAEIFGQPSNMEEKYIVRIGSDGRMG